MADKNLKFSEAAQAELAILVASIHEVMDLAVKAFTEHDLDAAYQVEPLEEVIDDLKEQMRTRHILRMQKGNCSIEAGFIWSDLLSSLERVSDHCSNLATDVINLASQDRANFEALRNVKVDYSHFGEMYTAYTAKYRLP